MVTGGGISEDDATFSSIDEGTSSYAEVSLAAVSWSLLCVLPGIYEEKWDVEAGKCVACEVTAVCVVSGAGVSARVALAGAEERSICGSAREPAEARKV